MMKKLIVFVCLLQVVLISSASAALITYPDLIGVNPGEVDYTSIGEDSATDPTPLFGAPTRIGNRLLFFPTSFSSYSAGSGSADTTSGTLQMTVIADEGHFLEEVKIKEYGDYTLAGVGTAATSAVINGLLTVTDLTNGGVLTDILSVTPASPYTLPGDSFSPFSAIVNIDLTGMGITMLVLNFNNNLQTTSESGTTAFIQKKVIDGPAFEVEVVPEPATIALLGLGILVLRRKHKV